MSRTLLAILLSCAAVTAQNTGIQFSNGSVDEGVDIAWYPGLVPTRGITVEAWVTFDDSTIPLGTYRWPTIARQDVAPGVCAWFLRVGSSNTGNRNLEWCIDTGAGLRFVTYPFAPGQFLTWTHIAATYDGQQAELYVNGTSVASAFVSGSIQDHGGVLRIGNGDVINAGHEVWNGQIDELRVWPFSRTGPEIQATMNHELFLAPGCLTFNFNGNFVDSSQQIVGTPTANVPFVQSQQLPLLPSGGFVFGTASTTCADRLLTSVGSVSRLGNPNFALICYDGPRAAQGVGLLGFGARRQPLRILGIDLHLDPGAMIPTGIPAQADSAGMTRLGVAVPNDPNLANVVVHSQFVFLSSGCGAAGLVGSTGLSVTLF